MYGIGKQWLSFIASLSHQSFGIISSSHLHLQQLQCTLFCSEICMICLTLWAGEEKPQGLYSTVSEGGQAQRGLTGRWAQPSPQRHWSFRGETTVSFVSVWRKLLQLKKGGMSVFPAINKDSDSNRAFFLLQWLGWSWVFCCGWFSP